MSDDLLQKITESIANNEQKILDDFCKAFIALKSLEGIPLEEVFKYYTLNIQTFYEKDSIKTKYWFSEKEA